MLNKLKILKALSDPTRFKIIELLLRNDFCVGALSNRLNITEAAISQHLKVLREAGLIWGEKRGYFTHYSVKQEVFKELSEEFSNLYELCIEKNKTCNNSCHKKC
ncbi:ArsR/SmtB family transcription factor [Natranaerobius trueperi]|uniref:HTH arsR-type domain-containing protein n=1 Tax=Natranaerobius trueperi TaxID=759412 RepID=A0A226BYA3_9FIRM|nr:metalloregulator ArsR/SmtB family transcription factor [Natranaerobius trueperi]OWZ83314.1 hypothetical protein CDO51_09250 [Natranaerobius trueperi]